MKKTKISVIGLGYVGLPTLVAITRSQKYNVVGFDINSTRINQIKNQVSPIEDTDVVTYLNSNKLFVSSNVSILKNSDIFIVCVPTPVYPDFTPDYSIIISAAKLIAPLLDRGSHFVLESTVNPGTCNEIIKPILESGSNLKAGRDFNIAHCPERINPGDTKWNIYNINRNIGSVNKKNNHEIAFFYRSFLKEVKINEVSSLEIAEATKIVENTFRDINIAYANELAKSFDAMGIDVIETIGAASNKPFGFMPHWPGAGVGGHCIAVDPYYLIQRAALSGFDHKFLKLAREINKSMPEYAVEKLILSLNKISKSIKGTKITLLGLSYKPNLGDTRESPAFEIRDLLIEFGAELVVYDPLVPKESNRNSLSSAIKNAEGILLATAHQEFIDNLPNCLKNSSVKVIIDGRNCLNNTLLPKHIIYSGIGR
jgi:UDP-N-acetyl-D-glucosamine dehydrogenase